METWVVFDVINQNTAAYWLYHKSKFTFYLRMFLVIIAIVNSHITYTKLGNSISLLDFKIAVAKSLIGRYSNQQQFLWAEQASKKHWSHHCQRKYQHTCQNLTRSACDSILAKMNELTIKHLYLIWPVCGLYLFHTKVSNCFLKHHV